ncbi:hypothetical protein BSKO_14026 [Bryopsis sp. KO-2023]|nr:hypothetical protein BSKO_14026 [Bryopsis sp. KO-2023]
MIIICRHDVCRHVLVYSFVHFPAKDDSFFNSVRQELPTCLRGGEENPETREETVVEAEAVVAAEVFEVEEAAVEAAAAAAAAAAVVVEEVVAVERGRDQGRGPAIATVILSTAA